MLETHQVMAHRIVPEIIQVMLTQVMLMQVIQPLLVRLLEIIQQAVETPIPVTIQPVQAAMLTKVADVKILQRMRHPEILPEMQMAAEIISEI
jgi:hypothetical protein